MTLSETYDDASPNETVFVSGVGSMSLKAAVRRYRHAGGDDVVVNCYRDIGKTPSVFDAVDLERLSRLKRFKVLGAGV